MGERWGGAEGHWSPWVGLPQWLPRSGIVFVQQFRPWRLVPHAMLQVEAGAAPPPGTLAGGDDREIDLRFRDSGSCLLLMRRPDTLILFIK